MRVAVISDIHANLEALEAALIAIEREGIDRIICLGDIVGYGPDPLGCIYRLQEVEALGLLGNHDQAVINPPMIRTFNATARPSLIYACECIGEQERAYLEGLPLIIEGGEIEGLKGLNDAVFAHASPINPVEWEPLFLHKSIANAMDAFERKIAFVGHTHYAGIHCKIRARTIALTSSIVAIGPHQYLVNSGSIGQPRHGKWGASYAIWDVEKNSVELHSVEYPVRRTQEKMQALGFPQFTIERLSQGV